MESNSRPPGPDQLDWQACADAKDSSAFELSAAIERAERELRARLGPKFNENLVKLLTQPKTMELSPEVFVNLDLVIPLLHCRSDLEELLLRLPPGCDKDVLRLLAPFAGSFRKISLTGEDRLLPQDLLVEEFATAIAESSTLTELLLYRVDFFLRLLRAACASRSLTNLSLFLWHAHIDDAAAAAAEAALAANTSLLQLQIGPDRCGLAFPLAKAFAGPPALAGLAGAAPSAGPSTWPRNRTLVLTSWRSACEMIDVLSAAGMISLQTEKQKQKQSNALTNSEAETEGDEQEVVVKQQKQKKTTK